MSQKNNEVIRIINDMCNNPLIATVGRITSIKYMGYAQGYFCISFKTCCVYANHNQNLEAHPIPDFVPEEEWQIPLVVEDDDEDYNEFAIPDSLEECLSKKISKELCIVLDEELIEYGVSLNSSSMSRLIGHTIIVSPKHNHVFVCMDDVNHVENIIRQNCM